LTLSSTNLPWFLVRPRCCNLFSRGWEVHTAYYTRMVGAVITLSVPLATYINVSIKRAKQKHCKRNKSLRYKLETFHSRRCISTIVGLYIWHTYLYRPCAPPPTKRKNWNYVYTEGGKVNKCVCGILITADDTDIGSSNCDKKKSETNQIAVFKKVTNKCYIIKYIPSYSINLNTLELFW